jgi:hypothetical protein
LAPISSARIARVVADADAEMYDMLTQLRRGGGRDRRRIEARAGQVALRQDADHFVGVQVNRVGIRPSCDNRRPSACSGSSGVARNFLLAGSLGTQILIVCVLLIKNTERNQLLGRRLIFSLAG